jgi:monoamine oxidase
MTHSSPPSDAVVNTVVDTVVVGAGVTGLRCAHRLVDHGLAVVVLEARDRVGGRLWSVAQESTGPRLDLGATWFWPQEPRITALVEELGLPTHPQHIRGDAVYEDLQGVQRIAGNPIDAPAGRFSLGAQSVAEALAERLPEGVVRTSSPVTAVSVTEDRVRVHGEAGRIDAGSVVVALPPALAVASIDFDPPLPEPLASVAAATPVWMGSTAKVVVRYADAFWRREGLAGAAVSHRGPLREVHDMSGPEGEPPALFGFAAPPSMSGRPDELAEEGIVAQLVRLFGPRAGTPVSIDLMDWSREARTTPAGAPPSQRYDLYGHAAFQRPVHGRIHLASTETALAFAGHIEGALMAGDETARRIVDGRPTVPGLPGPPPGRRV